MFDRKAWLRSPSGIASAKKYETSEKGKSTRRRYTESGRRREVYNAYVASGGKKQQSHRWRNSERGRAYRRSKEYFMSNREQTKRWSSTLHGRAKILEYIHSDKRKERVRLSLLDIRITLINTLGRTCINCGFSDIRALELDHINNDGYIRRGEFGSSYSEMIYYTKHHDILKERLQVMCANCHSIKTHETREKKRAITTVNAR